MKKLLNSKWGVIGLALLAVAALVQSIALPLIQSNASTDLLVDMVDPLLDNIIEAIDQPLFDGKLSRSDIEISKLGWIENPSRNPFQHTPEPIDETLKSNKKIEPRTVVDPPQLDAIIINDHARYAVLGTEIIATGENLGEFQIQSIQSNHVDLTGPNGPVRLHLIEALLEKENETTN